MALIFTDGFESGDFSGWSWPTTSGTGVTLSVTTGAARTGSYGLLAEGITSNQNWSAFVTKTFTAPATNIIHLRCWINIRSASTGGGLRVIRLNGSGVFNLFRLSDYYGQWRVFIRRKDGNNEEIDISAPSSGEWVQVDVLYDITGANPICKVWINASLVVNFTDTYSGSTAMPNELQLGAAEESWSQTATLWSDDVSLWDDAANIPGGVTDKSASDSAALSEGASSIAAAFTRTDSATLTDAGSIAASLTRTDSATASESGSIAAALSATDSATLTEAGALAPALAQNDGVSLLEAAALWAQLAGVDSGTLSEMALVEILSSIAASDGATLSEGVSIVVTPVNNQAPIYPRASGTAPRMSARTGTRRGPHTGAR